MKQNHLTIELYESYFCKIYLRNNNYLYACTENICMHRKAFKEIKAKMFL